MVNGQLNEKRNRWTVSRNMSAYLSLMEDAEMIRRSVLAVLEFYQKHISPLFPRSCRFEPSCSEYAIRAVSRYGVVYGGYFAVWRIMRCHPLGPTGYDPVP